MRKSKCTEEDLTRSIAKHIERDASPAERSILGQETGESKDHKSQEDDHVLLDTISATFYF